MITMQISLLTSKNIWTAYCILTFDRAVSQGFPYTRCTCVNEKVTRKQAMRESRQITSVDYRKYCRGVMKLYIHGYPRQIHSASESCSHKESLGQSQRAAGVHQELAAYSAPPPVEYLLSRHKALNMHSQGGLRKDQYSGPPSQYLVSSSPCLCLSHTPTPVLTITGNKERRIFLCKESVMPLHYGP